MADSFIEQVKRDRESISRLSEEERTSLTSILNFFASGDRIALGEAPNSDQSNHSNQSNQSNRSTGPAGHATANDPEDVHGIPITELVKYLNVFTDKPIVSVGCGPGLYEAETLKLNPRLDFIMVDPDPRSFENVEPKLAIDAATVPDLIKTRPELVGKCVLLLIWPNPNESTYDYQAVELLNPVAVVTIYEAKGAAGGDQFHCWLSTVGAKSAVETTPFYDSNKITLSKTYRMRHYYLTRIQGQMDMELRTMVMVTRHDYVIPETLDQIKNIDLAPPGWDRRRDNEICSIM
jgi:hypothetical protein